MANTDRTTIRYKNNLLDLTTLSREELEMLRTSLYLDMVDVENQVGWARQEEREGGHLDRSWMKKAIIAAKIKRDDIGKIDALTAGMPYSKSKAERDIIELKRAIRDYLNRRLYQDALEQRLIKLDEVYGK